MITISIDNESCIKCAKCIKVCPTYIFIQESTKADIGLQNIHTCIACGHCVATCPTDSIIHSKFPKEKVHTLNRNILPTPEQVMELCKARRSNRAFLPSPIPNEYLHQIVKAAYLAPTAGNGQEISFTLITNEDILKQISDITINTFEAAVKKITNPFIKPILGVLAPETKGAAPKLNAVIQKHKSGTDAILRGAKAVLFFHSPSSANFGKQDANLAYQNASLMAESLGVSQFYTGYVCIATELDKKRKLSKLLNIEGTIYAGMALSMPAFKFPKYIDRDEIKLNVL